MGQRILVLSDVFLPMILGEGPKHFRVTKSPLPFDARVTNCEMKFIGKNYQELHLLLESSEWATHAEGKPIPSLDLRISDIHV